MTLSLTAGVGVGALILGALGLGASNDPAAPTDTKGAAIAIQHDAERRVTGKFDNAKLADVLKWLGGYGVNFVADAKQTTGDERLTLSVTNQPLKDVMDAIASAFGGKWSKHGDVYTFSRARTFAFGPDMQQGGAFVMPKIDVEGLEDIAPEIKRGIDEMMKELKEKGLMGEGKAFKFHFSPEDMKDFEMKFKDLKGLEELKGLKELELKELKDLPRFELRAANIGKLLDSLTVEQLAKQEKQGYLTPADLTPEQRKMLGNLPDGDNWSINYVVNGKKLSLRAK